MPRERQREPGRVVRVPLGGGVVGWGRQLRSAMVEFYDRFDPDATAPDVDPQGVVGSEIAFTVAVMDRAFRRPSTWVLLDVIPLSPEEQTITHRSFKEDPGSGSLSIYWEKADGSWGEDVATREECTDLEPAAVWDPEHVEDRLRDHRAGRNNKWSEALKLTD